MVRFSTASLAGLKGMYTVLGDFWEKRDLHSEGSVGYRSPGSDLNPAEGGCF